MDVLFATDFTTREVLFLVAVPFVALGIGASCFGIYGHLKDYIRPSLQRSPPLSVPNPLSEPTRRINGGLNGIKKKMELWRLLGKRKPPYLETGLIHGGIVEWSCLG